MNRFGMSILAALFGLGAIATAAQAASEGNSAAAEACQHDGYKALVGTDGGFRNVGECVSYAARGGSFVTPQPGQFLVPAGQTATLSDTVLARACNSVTYGYALDDGSTTALASKPYGCSTLSQPDATIGPFDTAVILRLFLGDHTCNQTFYSDGNHALVSGSNPYDVDIMDAGGFCEAPEGTPRSPADFGGLGNLSTTVTIG
jgi:hypothetical protein